jgi:hypothetical protein
MTKLSAVARTKIAKILPMLGSDRSGEALAAGEALRRILKAEGLDLHDLAASLVDHDRPPVAPQEEKATNRGPPTDEVRKRTWAAKQAPPATRPEAIRSMIEALLAKEKFRSEARDAEENARRQSFRDVADIRYWNVHGGVDLDELEEHWLKLREAERALVRKFKWRYDRRRWCEADVIRRLEALSGSVGQRRRTYKIARKPSKRRA